MLTVTHYLCISMPTAPSDFALSSSVGKADSYQKRMDCKMRCALQHPRGESYCQLPIPDPGLSRIAVAWRLLLCYDMKNGKRMESVCCRWNFWSGSRDS